MSHAISRLRMDLCEYEWVGARVLVNSVCGRGIHYSNTDVAITLALITSVVHFLALSVLVILLGVAILS